MAQFAGMDLAASGQRTREILGWQPQQAGLIADIDHGRYFETVRPDFATAKAS